MKLVLNPTAHGNQLRGIQKNIGACQRLYGLINRKSRFLYPMWSNQGRTCCPTDGNNKVVLKVRGNVTGGHGG
jgi:hypothetical protein